MSKEPTREEWEAIMNALERAEPLLCGDARAWVKIGLAYLERAKPTPLIPDLIDRWHAEPTLENRKALWEAITDQCSQGNYKFSHGGSIYRSAPRMTDQSGWGISVS